MKNSYLQKFRKSQGVSTAEIAKKMKISQSMYEKVEFGYRNPSYRFITQLKNAYPEADANELMACTDGEGATHSAEDDTIAPAT